MINPLAVIFEQIRVWVLPNQTLPRPSKRQGGVGWPDPRRGQSSSRVCAFGAWIFNREAPRIAEEL